MSRFESVVITFYEEFEGRRTMILDLTREDQADPRLIALVDWIRERNLAQARAAGEAGGLL